MEFEKDTRKRIIDTTVELLLEEKDANQITIRQIAKSANVNVALINYHFQSKDNLLNEAVGVCMMNIAKKIFESSPSNEDPIDKLKSMIKNNATFGLKYYNLSQIAVSIDLKQGNMGTSQTILPILKQIFGDKKSETELKFIALQLIVPLQVMFLNPQKYKDYLFIDIFDEQERNKLIDQMIDNILKGGY